MNTRLHLVAKIIIGILVILLVGLVFLLARQYQEIQRAGIIQAERSHFENLREKGMLTSSDIQYIEPWMTFNYIDVSFKLPSDYLKMSLAVADPHYPEITLGRYARSIATSSEALTLEVQNTVKEYLSSTTSEDITR